MSDIIYTPPASGGGTTINPTNNFIPKRSNATTFIDSVLENGSNYLYSNYGGFTGLGLDFANFTSYLGDWNNLINGTTLVVNDQTNNIYTKWNGLVTGINLDFAGNNYLIGDNSANYIFINGNNELIDFVVSSIAYAELDGLNNVGFFGGTACTFRFDANNLKSSIGDYNGNNNSTFILNDDDLKICQLNSNGGIVRFDYGSIELNGPTSPTASGPADHLEVIVNGNPYKIQLLNP